MGSGESESPPDRLSRSLWGIVAVLGAATFSVSFASPVALGFPVHLSVFAAIVAAVGLVRGQDGRGWLVLAGALTGFLDAVATWVRSHETGWPLTVIMVLTALQSLVAVGALIQEATARRSAGSDPSRDYLAYTQFATAYQAYAMGYQQPSDPEAAGQATAPAHGDGSAVAHSTVDAEQDPLAALQARYAKAGVGPAPHSAGATGASPARPAADPGLPGVDHSVPGHRPYPPQQEGYGQASSI
jgi:hypothetical protein